MNVNRLLTDGHPLHWVLTFSATIPTAASLPSIDLTTPATSFPAASSGPASVPFNLRLCLRKRKNYDVKCVYITQHHRFIFSSDVYLDMTLAATVLRALTARKCTSSATAERMNPSSSVNTVTELDFLFTPRTCEGHIDKWCITDLVTFIL